MLVQSGETASILMRDLSLLLFLEHRVERVQTRSIGA